MLKFEEVLPNPNEQLDWLSIMQYKEFRQNLEIYENKNPEYATLLILLFRKPLQ